MMVDRHTKEMLKQIVFSEIRPAYDAVICKDVSNSAKPFVGKRKSFENDVMQLVGEPFNSSSGAAYQTGV